MNFDHITSSLEVRHLRLIEAITHFGTMTRAAAALNLTQPALSHQLRDMEERLGTLLFERQARRMLPTPAGERLAITARSVLGELSVAEAEARLSKRQSPIQLRISTGCYTCYHWLPPRLITLRRRFPQLQVHIAAEYTRRPVDGLLDGHVDVAIVSDPVTHARLWSERLFHDEMVLVVPTDHPFAGRSYVEPARLVGETLVLYNAPRELLTIFTDVLVPAGIEPKEVLHIELTEAIVEMVRAGMGMGFLARWAAQPYLRGGGLSAVRLTRKGIHREWSAVMRRCDRKQAHVAQLVQLMRDQSL